MYSYDLFISTASITKDRIKTATKGRVTKQLNNFQHYLALPAQTIRTTVVILTAGVMIIYVLQVRS